MSRSETAAGIAADVRLRHPRQALARPPGRAADPLRPDHHGAARIGFIHGAGALTVAWILGGYLFWTLTEYWLHRIVFHFEPEDGIGAKLHWIIHGVHHDHPNDPMRLVMPPSVASRWRRCSSGSSRW